MKKVLFRFSAIKYFVFCSILLFPWTVNSDISPKDTLYSTGTITCPQDSLHGTWREKVTFAL